MAIKYRQVLASEINAIRKDRQRKTLGDVGILADSIKRVGLINPITVDKALNLVAGERRLTACKMIDPDYKISVRFYEDLDDITRQIIELEENVKREELSWQDQANSVRNIHELYKSLDPNWNMTRTAEAIGLNPSGVSNYCLVASNLAIGNKVIENSTSLTQALAALSRDTGRAIDNELNDLLEAESTPKILEKEVNLTPGKTARIEKAIPKEPEVISADFNAWAPAYSGRRFSFIHCDFPYGIDHGKSEQGGITTGRYEGYEDSEDTYWKLCATLARNIDKLMMNSGHIMFWLSMNYYTETIEFFETYNIKLVMPQPLIWYKSDGKGIVSDVQRRPRNIYEAALLFSKGDRKIITPVDNLYSGPTSKDRLHPSEKPEAMLRHFFRMFVDNCAEVLDPTCGAGSTLRAADSLKASRILGLELNPEFADEAQRALTRSRSTQRAEEKKDEQDSPPSL